MNVEPFWMAVEGPTLRQGDYVPRCLVPLFHPSFGSADEIHEVRVHEFDLIVVTQSCDLETGRSRLVALCPIYHISRFEEISPEFSRKGRWNEVLKGRTEGLHLLASPTDPGNNRDARVVDFREIYSLPYPYLVKQAVE